MSQISPAHQWATCVPGFNQARDAIKKSQRNKAKKTSR